MSPFQGLLFADVLQGQFVAAATGYKQEGKILRLRPSQGCYFQACFTLLELRVNNTCKMLFERKGWERGGDIGQDE